MTEKSNNQQNKDFTESSRRGGRKYFSQGRTDAVFTQTHLLFSQLNIVF